MMDVISKKSKINPMLQINLKRVCTYRGIEKPRLFLKSHGMSLTTINRVLRGDYESFNLATIERLCLILHCTPNDLLEWHPSKSGLISDTEPLYSLRRLDKVESVNQLINGVSLDKLEQMEAIIRKEMGV